MPRLSVGVQEIKWMFERKDALVEDGAPKRDSAERARGEGREKSRFRWPVICLVLLVLEERELVRRVVYLSSIWERIEEEGRGVRRVVDVG